MITHHSKAGFIRGIAGAALLMLHAASAGAEEPLREFMKCLETGDDQARLACYDRLANTLVELGPDAALAPASAGVAAGAALSQSDEQAALPTPEEAFGNERVECKDAIESITANVVGGFAGWDADTTFELDNGQVWQQSAPGRFSYGGPDRAVTIRRAAFGSFMLSPDGLNRTVRVKRIK
jgi:hypothetical protein